jgi:hypothetical protein
MKCHTAVLLEQNFLFKTNDNAEIITSKKWLMTRGTVFLLSGASKHEQSGEEVPVQADRRAQAHGRGGGARRPERPPAGALGDAGALLGWCLVGGFRHEFVGR